MKKTILLIMLAIAVICIMVMSCIINPVSDAKSQYFCNQKLLSFVLNVNVEDMHNNKLYNINGEFFSTYEDDLAMTDNAGNVVMRTDDQYNLITQNNHTICRNDEVLYHCNGQFKFFADSYNITDKDGNDLASVQFNMFDTVGIMRDTSGNVIARYDSSLLRRDYIVSIFDDCTIDEESVLMIFASYVSDVRADSN